MARRRTGWVTRSEKAAQYHAEFADSIVKAIEHGTAPWQKPWAAGARHLPHNFQTDQVYRGSNTLHLQMRAAAEGYQDPRWGGYQQIVKAGGHVRAGETGTRILYVSTSRHVPVVDDRGNAVVDREGTPQREQVVRVSPLVTVHTVFNVEQTDGLDLPARATEPAWEGHQRAEGLCCNFGRRRLVT